MVSFPEEGCGEAPSETDPRSVSHIFDDNSSGGSGLLRSLSLDLELYAFIGVLAQTKAATAGCTRG